jgi:hypothetical protein
MRQKGIAYMRLCRVLAATVLAAVPINTVSQPGAESEEPAAAQKQVEERLKAREALGLTIRTPDGRSFKVDVSPSEFAKTGYLAAGRDVCPPPNEKISDKCVKCGNGNVACRD